MNAADLVAHIKGRFTTRQGFHRARCQTGDQYECFGHYDGINAPEFFEDEDVACHFMLVAFDAYVERLRTMPGVVLARSTLWWRYDAPHVFWHDKDGPPENRGLGVLRTRLVLTCNPVVWDTVEAYDAVHDAHLAERLQGATYGRHPE